MYWCASAGFAQKRQTQDWTAVLMQQDCALVNVTHEFPRDACQKHSCAVSTDPLGLLYLTCSRYSSCIMMGAEEPPLTFHVRGIHAFHKNDYAHAVELWSRALELQEDTAPVILCNRSTAYAQLGRWDDALIDARQAVQLAPSNVKAQYRLAQAYLHLEQYQQCQDACKAALQTKSGVTQLQRLSQLAESMMRGCFIKGREVEEEQCHHQQQLQHHVAQNSFSARAGRRHADALQKEEFLRWQDHDCHANCLRGNVCAQAASGDESYQLLDLEVGATLTDIRLAFVQKMKKAHPDKGGSAEQFCSLQRAYHRLVQTVTAGCSKGEEGKP